MTPKAKLRQRAWAVNAEALVKEGEKTLQSDREIADGWYLELGDLMCDYDASPYGSPHEIA
jgi:hypothetical protein